jgi:hypothetical protein
MAMQQEPKSRNATAPKHEPARESAENTELSKTELDRVAGGKSVPGRWKTGDITLTRG